MSLPLSDSLPFSERAPVSRSVLPQRTEDRGPGKGQEGLEKGGFACTKIVVTNTGPRIGSRPLHPNSVPRTNLSRPRGLRRKSMTKTTEGS